MALFTINRYHGEEQDYLTTKRISEDVVSQRLDKLLSSARTKKRKSQEMMTNISVESMCGDDEQVSSERKLSHKKCKLLPKKEHRKKRRKELDNKQLTNDDDELDSPPNGNDETGFNFSNDKPHDLTTQDSANDYDNGNSIGDVINGSHDPVHTSRDCDGARNECDESEYFPVLGGKTKPHEKPVVLRKLPSWMENPTLVEVDIKGNSVPLAELTFTLPDVILKNLRKMGIIKFFPVQYHIIPEILTTSCGPLLGHPSGRRPQDVCVNAPTGSGKTLAYAIPIVTALMNRVVCRVRGLIVVPSRDLANQVKAVLNDVAKGTGLKVVTITGQTSIEKEEAELVNHATIPVSSGADVVIATPGRLVDHMSLTKHFFLRHLRFLVIDEVDRLLDQSFQEWITKLFEFINTKEEQRQSLSLHTWLTPNDTFPNLTPDPKFDISIPIPHSPIPFQPVVTATSIQSNLQKLLFSATIPQNPEKLALLKLYSPKLFTTAVVDDTEGMGNYVGRFALPSTLREYSIVCPAKMKPLAVIYLIQNEGIKRVLCFTSSKDSTHRLCLLLKHYGLSEVAEYSANLPQKKRKSVLSDFRSGKVDMLVCSDAMSRGMDVDMVCLFSIEPILLKHLRNSLMDLESCR